MHHQLRRLLALFLLCMLLAACGAATSPTVTTKTTPTTASTPSLPSTASSPAPYPTDTSSADVCPRSLSFLSNCQTPQSMRIAYGIAPLIQKGFTGKGQTVVDIVSFGSPTLQHDMDVFDNEFGLPPITIQQIKPLNVPESDPHNDKAGWASETTLDVEIIHALAPDAGIVVLISPVAETEGTVGLPEFRQLLQYSIDHKLGNIISQSWGASELTLKDAAGQAEIQKWDAIYKQATTQGGLTILSASGDNGATDYMDLAATRLSPNPTTSFPADDPWVTAVGGTSLHRSNTHFSETAWDQSGGGFSAFFPAPSFQQNMSASVQNVLKNRRGVPDVSGNADPSTGLAMYQNGTWTLAGGTSASTPMWAALIAIGNQMAGHPLGFLNPTLYRLSQSPRYAQDFHDITVGNNSVNANGVVVTGYDAIAGWDAVTGVGSPNAANLLPDLIAATVSPGQG
ncbi:MAG TPA: S53 family peptidase [Ktedonobacteraceae bacterium]|nr:S53 family peptidase [Ktedonobacteraceae bacterium]